MDNHQAELADELEHQGYITVASVTCVPLVFWSACRKNSQHSELDAQLPAWLDSWMRHGGLKPFPALQGDRFRSVVDEMAGFA